MSNPDPVIMWQTAGQQPLFEGSLYHDHSNAWLQPGISDDLMSDDEALELLGGTWAGAEGDDSFGAAGGWV